MYGYAMNKQDVLTRLRRIEGQVRGLARMVEEDQYCIDILTQVNAVHAALRGVAIGLLDDHVRHCVRESIESGGGDEKVEEMVSAVARAVPPVTQPPQLNPTIIVSATEATQHQKATVLVGRASLHRCPILRFCQFASIR